MADGLLDIHRARHYGRTEQHSRPSSAAIPSTQREHAYASAQPSRKENIRPSSEFLSQGAPASRYVADDNNTSLIVARLRPRSYQHLLGMSSSASSTISTDAEDCTKQPERKKSIRKRVLSKVKEGVLSRSKSTSGVDELPTEQVHELPRPGAYAMESRRDLSMHLSLHHGVATGSHQCHGVESVMRKSPHQTSSSLQDTSIPWQSHIQATFAIAMETIDINNDNRIETAIEIYGVPGSVHALVEHADINVPVFTGLLVVIKPGPLFQLESTPGTMSVETLKIDERISIPIELQKAAKMPSPTDPGETEHSDIHSLVDDIEAILGGPTAELFRLKVTYTHPALPLGTSVTLRRTCHVRLGSSSVISSYTPSPSSGLPIASLAPIVTAGAMEDLEARGARSVSETTDGARAVWRHIRSDSKSLVVHQRLSVFPTTLQDNQVASLRQTAIVNKRSVDEETLNEWRNDVASSRASLPAWQSRSAYQCASTPWC